MGFIGLPVTLFLLWLMLRTRKNDPLPKGGLIRLMIAAAVSVVVSIILTLPVSGIILFLRMGIFSDLEGWNHILHEGPEVFEEAVKNAFGRVQPSFFWNMVNMFLGAGLLEEGLKFLTCRMAVRKEGMIRTWMDSVAAFAIVGILFEFIENVAFGFEQDLVSALVRSLSPAHFVFGVIMGFFYGKYLVTGQKRYCLLSLGLPVIYHTLTNTLVVSMHMNEILRYLGIGSGISYLFTASIAVLIILRWQKNKTLDIPVQQKVK